MEPSFMYTQTLKEILFPMKYDRQFLNDFTAIVGKMTTGLVKNIDRLESEYLSYLAIQWYTASSFICSMLNRGLYTLETETIVKTVFHIRYLYYQIEERYLQQFGNYHGERVTVYRGQSLSTANLVK
jgi:hypothetical protein